MRYLIASLVFLICSCAYAETPTDKAEAFLKIVSEDSDKAIDQLFAGSGIAEQKPQAVQALKGQTKAAMSIYGKAIGFEKALDEEITPSLRRIVYIQKFPLLPVAWEMYFYRATDKWVLNTILFNDQVGLLVGAKK